MSDAPPQDDPRRRIPRTDTLLAGPELAAAVARHGREAVVVAVRAAQDRARRGELAPEEVGDAAVQELLGRGRAATVLNATGVVLHTNLGRARLSEAAVESLVRAAGATDVELDLATGVRARRGRDALAALTRAVPDAEAALVVNNGAAALLLAVTALAQGREVLVSRGEMVEIGDGFRIPELVESTGARIREVGTTNRTRLADYADAVTAQTGMILKVHPSNFRVQGFTSEVGVRDLAPLGLPVVADTGSGLLAPDPALPEEPDARTALRDGATVVTCSGDKLLGGPQAGLVLGRAEVVERLRRHPLQRALRADKLTLAALAATLDGASTPTWEAVHVEAAVLRERAERLADLVGGEVVPSEGAVGGGAAPGLSLAGWAVALPESYAAPLRLADPAVVGRLEGGRTLLDVRCLTDRDLADVARAVAAVRGDVTGAGR